MTKEAPFHPLTPSPPRVEAILEMIQMGNIMPDEIKMVCNLLHQYADIFTLSV